MNRGVRNATEKGPARGRAFEFLERKDVSISRPRLRATPSLRSGDVDAADGLGRLSLLRRPDLPLEGAVSMTLPRTPSRKPAPQPDDIGRPPPKFDMHGSKSNATLEVIQSRTATRWTPVPVIAIAMEVYCRADAKKRHAER
jgi:hypothetical protein